MAGSDNGISGVALAAIAAGSLFLYAGLRGFSVLTAIKNIVRGIAPGSGQHTAAIAGTAALAGTAAAAGTTPSAIANDALRYQGHPYVYGGAPGSSGMAGWDCSSFANWVLGHDLGMMLPGQSSPGYDGTTHGPTTLGYLVWNGAQTVGHSPSEAQAGDLLVWQTHMGFALGGGQMISALNEHLGTQVTTIAGGSPGDELLFVRRIEGLPTPTGQAPPIAHWLGM